MIKVGNKYTVSVIKILDKGLIVRILGTSETQLIHISKLSHEYIEDINTFAKLGDVFEALCINGFSKPELSIKALSKPKIQKKINSPKSSKLKVDLHQENHLSIDDMIASAEATLKDKFGNAIINKRRRRMTRRDGYYE